MAYFPFMIEVSGKKCLVVGGGKIAFHKVKVLLGFDVELYVAAPVFDPAFQGLEAQDGALTMREREFRDSDIDGMDFVVAATGVRSIDQKVAQLCREQGIPVNVVDMKEECSFIFPAMIRSGDVLVTVSSGGKSPAAVSWLKNRICGQIPDYYGKMVEELGKYREYILKEIDSPQRRKEIFYQLLAYGEEHEGDIPEAEVRRLAGRKECFSGSSRNS